MKRRSRFFQWYRRNVADFTIFSGGSGLRLRRNPCRFIGSRLQRPGALAVLIFTLQLEIEQRFLVREPVLL